MKKHVLPIIFYKDISDHLPICAIVKCNPIEKTASRLLRRIISQDNIELFLEDLSYALNTSEMRNSKNLEHLATLLNDLTNVYFPKKTLSRRQFKTSKNPWIASGILTSIKHKNRMYAKYLKDKSSTAYANYKNIETN